MVRTITTGETKDASSAGLHHIRRAVIKGFKHQFWSVKFYPYILREDDPVIFAAISFTTVCIYEAKSEGSGLRCLLTCQRPPAPEKEFESGWLNCCTWCFINEEEPLLALAGESGHISIIDAFSGKLVHTLVGHSNGTVNELVTHPDYPYLIASASIDHSIRVWDLRRASVSALSTCITICGHSMGHTAGLVTLDWHHTGRYLVSGGYDHRICVWTLPDYAESSPFWHEISYEGRKRSRDEVRVIHYPHFVSSAIHGDYVDTVRFLGDLVLSRAAQENKVVLWSITGFHSANHPPPSITAPKGPEYLETKNGFRRNAFMRIDDNSQTTDKKYSTPELYHRCLEFENKDSTSIYWRFGVRKPSKLFPHVRPLLTVGNHGSNIRHWDIQALIEGHEGAGFPTKSAGKYKKTITEPVSKNTSKHVAGRSVSEFSGASVSGGSSSTEAADRSHSHERNMKRFALNDAEAKLLPHRQLDESKDMNRFSARAIDWSICGQWCVAVGELPNAQGVPTGGIILYSITTK